MWNSHWYCRQFRNPSQVPINWLVLAILSCFKHGSHEFCIWSQLVPHRQINANSRSVQATYQCGFCMYSPVIDLLTFNNIVETSLPIQILVWLRIDQSLWSGIHRTLENIGNVSREKARTKRFFTKKLSIFRSPYSILKNAFETRNFVLFRLDASTKFYHFHKETCPAVKWMKIYYKINKAYFCDVYFLIGKYFCRVINSYSRITWLYVWKLNKFQY